MNRFFSLALWLCFGLVFSACGSRQDKPAVGMNFTKVLEGIKANRYKITMSLKATEGKLEGSYYYNNQGVDIPLKGWLRKDGEFQLTEYNPRGQEAGVFEGQFLEGKKLEGQWRKPFAVQTLAFFAQETKALYDENRKKLKIPGLDDMELSTFSGIYFSTEPERVGRLELKYQGEGKISFTIIAGTPSNCRATLEGIAIFSDNSHARFKSSGTEDADLEFLFYEKNLTVKEKKGGNYHGTGCSFGGQYLWKERE